MDSIAARAGPAMTDRKDGPAYNGAMTDPLHLPQLVAAWERPDFEARLKEALAGLGQPALPLQAGLRYGNHALDAPLEVVPLARERLADGRLRVRAGLCYQSLIAGCACADDPTPETPLAEYCEIELLLDPCNGAARIRLRED